MQPAPKRGMQSARLIICAVSMLWAASQPAHAARLDAPFKLRPLTWLEKWALGNTVPIDAAPSQPPIPPVWPSQYTVSFDVSIPAMFSMQPQGLTFPVKVWFDGHHQRMRVEVLGGLDTVITTGNAEYTLYPRINETNCKVFQSASALLGEMESFLPSLENWEYTGSVPLEGEEAYIWTTTTREGTKVSEYKFYTTPTGHPLRFDMNGVNFFTDSHFDEFNYKFTSFFPKLEWSKADDPFVKPLLCQATSRVAEVISSRHPVALQAHALTPRVRAYDVETAYHAFARAAHPSGVDSAKSHLAGGRAHSEHASYAARLDLFQQAALRIKTHNADPSQTYRMRPTRWSDWTDHEFHNLMLPNKARKEALGQARLETLRKSEAYKPLGKFKRRMTREQLPKHVDWTGTRADPGVKDQGMCGSCFSFSATGAMEGAWFVSTGEHRAFSEQQILDCSWNYGTNGCAGGDYEPSINYVRDAGGIALEQTYNYLSNSDFCKADNATKPGKFKGFLFVESRDELALMEAVATTGPVAVAVDAEAESFRSYAEGIYTTPTCATASADLDHAVILFGYGTENGVDYWLVRNTWAQIYGINGCIKIERGKGDCGISTEPVIAVVADGFTVPGNQERAKQAWV